MPEHRGTPRPGARRAPWLRLAALVVVLAVSVGTAVAVQPLDPDGLRQGVEGPGGWRHAVAVVVYAVCTQAGVPRNVASTTAGVLLGLGWGLAVAYGGSLLGAAVAFWTARLLGRDAAVILGGERGAALDERLVRRGFWAVLGARLAPFVPFAVFNYFAGATGLRWSTYAWGTVLGLVPGTVLYVAVGSHALAPGDGPVELLVGAFVLVTAYTAFRVARRLRADG